MTGIWVGLRLNARHQYVIEVCITLHQTAHLGIAKASFAFQLIKSVLNLSLRVFWSLVVLLFLVFQKVAHLIIKDG